jgi:ABC-2 type transport system permease protein
MIRSELTKLTATRSTWVLAAAAGIFCALWTVVSIVAGGQPGDDGIRTAYQNAQQAFLFSLIVGILGMTGEYRHQTITWTFLASRDRRRVLLAKFAAYGLIAGLGIAVVAACCTAAAATVTLGLRGLPLTAPGLAQVLLGATASTTVYAMLGVCLGALIRNQAAAIAVAFGWFYYAEYLLVWLLPEVGKWVPGGAAKSLIGFSLDGTLTLLPAWIGGPVFLGYTVVFGVLAYVITTRRDVT